MAGSLDILYADEAIIILNKPAGVYVHPAPGHETGTLTELLLARYPEIAHVGSSTRPGVVHRLDAGTSGVMVFARTAQAYAALREQFESHRDVQKTYLAIVHGTLPQPNGTCLEPIGRKAWDAKRMAVCPLEAGGKKAVTHWQVLSRRQGLSLVECTIETGRTHQIRVHMAHLGCPIVGDDLYGQSAADLRLKPRPKRPLLHAVTLSFLHPTEHRRVTFSAEPPADIIYAC